MLRRKRPAPGALSISRRRGCVSTASAATFLAPFRLVDPEHQAQGPVAGFVTSRTHRNVSSAIGRFSSVANLARLIKMLLLLSFLSLASAVLASPGTHAAFASNLAYRSPSLNIPGLETNLEGVKARLGKRATDYWTGDVEFRYGVASGDPYNTSAILWTRPEYFDEEGIYGNPSGFPICLHYTVSESKTDFSKNASAWDGIVQTTWDVGLSVKVEAQNLKPWTQ